MPSHKTLKSVVASLAQSFTSQLNYRGDDYVMGHIVLAAWSTGATRLRVDLRNGVIDPSPLVVPEVRDSLLQYARWLPDIVRRSDSSMDFVAEAELLVTVDPTMRRPLGHSKLQESPFACAVRVVDDRGKVHVHEIRDWWYPEKPPPAPRTKPWWRRGWSRLTAACFGRRPTPSPTPTVGDSNAPREAQLVESSRREAVAVCERVILGEFGVIAGCRRLARLGHDLVDDVRSDRDFVVFVAFDSETDDLPLEDERGLWNAAAFEEKQKEVARFELESRETVVAACRRVLRRLGGG